MPPKFDLKKIKDDNEYLCIKGSYTFVNNLDADKKPKKTKLRSYYTLSKTNVPVQILNTGNVQVLEKYLHDNSSKLTDKDRAHLQERIEVMNYINSLENEYQTKGRTSIGAMEVNDKGQKVFPNFVLNRAQDTSLGCWSCAFEMLLKSRGVNIDQKLIRRYRPEFVEGHEPTSPEQTDIINTNEISEMFQYSSLVNKISPNTKMCKMDYNQSLINDNPNIKEVIKSEVFSALREKNAPVAFCDGSHWTTIIGLSDDGKKFYIADSNNHTDPQNIAEINVDTYFNKYTGQFVWLEDMVLEKDGTYKQLPQNRYKVDEKTGAISLITNDLFEVSDNDMAISGSTAMDRTIQMESFVPTMIRNYTIPYSTQKIAAEQYIYSKIKKPIIPEPPKYVDVSQYHVENVTNGLKDTAERNAFTDQKCILRDQYFYTQEEIDAMDDHKAVEELYKGYKSGTLIVDQERKKRKEQALAEKTKKTEPEKPKQTEPEKPKQTEPEKPKQTEPEKPKQTEPEKPKQTEPEKPKQTEPENKKVEQKEGEEVSLLNQVKLSSKEIEDKRFQDYENKIKAAKQLKLSDRKTKLLEDIAANEYELGSIAEAYNRAPEKDKHLYSDTLRRASCEYITRLTINKKLESVDSFWDVDVEEDLTDKKSFNEFNKAIASTSAVDKLIANLMKNPQDMYFLNRENVYKDFLAQQKIAIEELNEQKKASAEKSKKTYQTLIEKNKTNKFAYWGTTSEVADGLSNKTPIKMNFSRSALQALAFSVMLKNGKSFADIANPGKEMAAERAKYMQDAIKLVEDNEAKEIAEIFYNAKNKTTSFLEQEFKRMGSISTEKYLSEDFKAARVAALYMMDLSQELDKPITYLKKARAAFKKDNPNKNIPDNLQESFTEEDIMKEIPDHIAYNTLFDGIDKGLETVVSSLKKDKSLKKSVGECFRNMVQSICESKFRTAAFNDPMYKGKTVTEILNHEANTYNCSACITFISSDKGIRALEKKLEKNEDLAQKFILSALDGTFEKTEGIDVKLGPDGKMITSSDPKKILQEIENHPLDKEFFQKKKYKEEVVKEKAVNEKDVNEKAPENVL